MQAFLLILDLFLALSFSLNLPSPFSITLSALFSKPYLEDLENIQEAQNRLGNPPERYLTLEEVEQELGLTN